MPLTAKQVRFCEEYLIDLNATQAAIRAGYSKKTAAEIGRQNLIKLDIQKYIQEKKIDLSEKTGITAERVLQELASIGFNDIKDFVNGGNSILEIKYIDSEKTRSISGIKTTSRIIPGKGEGAQPEVETTTELKFHSKISALELIGKHIGMFEKDNNQKQPIVQITGMRVE